jgi:hypothetical protein
MSKVASVFSHTLCVISVTKDYDCVVTISGRDNVNINCCLNNNLLISPNEFISFGRLKISYTKYNSFINLKFTKYRNVNIIYRLKCVSVGQEKIFTKSGFHHTTLNMS